MKMVILDCCHASAGLTTIPKLEQCIHTEGMYCVAAAQKGQAAKSFRGEKYTWFTNELLDVFDNGVPKQTNVEFTCRELGDVLHSRFEAYSKQKGVPDVPRIARVDSGNTVGLKFKTKKSGRVDSLHLLKDRDEFVKNLLGIKSGSLPRKVQSSKDAIAFAFAKNLARELMTDLTRLGQLLVEWEQSVDRVGPGQDLDSLWSLEECYAILRTLRLRLLNYTGWPEYSLLVDEILVQTGGFIRKIRDIVSELKQAAKDKNVDEFTLFDASKLVAVRNAFFPAQFNNWEKQAEVLWKDCCSRLE